MAYASRYGLTVADFKNLSIGFVLDFLSIQYKLNNKIDVHQDEINYYKLLDILPIVQEKYRIGQIKEERYQEWMAKFTALEKRYG